MLKKSLLLIIPIILLTGCTVESIGTEEKNDIYYMQDSTMFEFYVDKGTCVEYIQSYKGKGALIPRLNADGTVKLNTKCLAYWEKAE
jgi:hypothetical protein|nr:MAG TPA: foot protein [Caudoviricetes sp.]